MVARRCPHFINATAMCIAIVVFPEPPFSFPTTMTWGNPRDFTAALSIAVPRASSFMKANCQRRLARTSMLGEIRRSTVD
jgi:hypothetical protein